ncbi:MAG: hypothetical protein HW416_31 [Chloroflexi bacterium]|nr:hypothetical protein [Chloroflexota bacterium]
MRDRPGDSPTRAASNNLPTSAPQPSKKRGVFYGWYVVASAFCANFAYSEQFSSTYGVFIYHIGMEMGWGRTVLAGVKTVGRAGEVLAAPFVGGLVDRYGARWLMIIGGVFFAAGMILCSTVGEIWQLYLYLGVLMPLAGMGVGGLVATIAVSNWFVVKRGRAVGITAMGMSFGAMVAPLAISAVIAVEGWRVGWIVMGVAAFLLTLPAAFLVRRRPEDMGLLPDGAEPFESSPTSDATARPSRRQELLAADVVWKRRDVLRTPLLWVMSFAWGFAQFAQTSTNVHAVPFLQDLGYPIVLAATAVTVRSAATFVGNPIWGYVAERMPVKRAATLQFVLASAGVGMWLLPPSHLTIFAGLVLFGIGASGGQVLSELAWATYYGRVSLGTVRGIAYPIQTAFAAAGPLGVGLLYDLSGSYQLPFAVMIVGNTIAMALIQLIRPPNRPATARVTAEA